MPLSHPLAEAPPAAPPAAYEAVLHTELAAVAPLWRRLQAEGACTVYQRIEWAEGILRHLAGGAEPLFVSVSADGRPVLLLALLRRRSRLIRRIEALDLGVCDYAAPLLAPDAPSGPAEAERIWRALRAVLPAADLLHITRLPATVGGQRNPLADLAGARRLALTASGFALTGAPETLLKRVCTASAHRDIARRSRRIDGLSEAGFVAARTPEEAVALFDVLLAQRRARFREMGRFELLDRPGTAAFYRDAALDPGGTGLVRLFGLRAEGTWIATAMGLVHGGAFHGVLLAMEGGPWSRHAPGLVIAARIMVWARAQGLDYFDFTVGAQPYKDGFQPVVHPLFEVAEALSLRGRLLLRAEAAAGAARAALERHPALAGRLRALVRRLRRWRGSKRSDQT